MKQIYKILGIIGLIALLGVVFGDEVVSPEWEYETGDWVHSVAISSDGKYVVAGSKDWNVYFFDKNGNLLWKYKTGGDVESVAITPDGNYVVAGSDDYYVYFFDKNGNLLWKYETGWDVGSVEISSDGNYIVAGSNDDYVYFFDKNGNLLWKYKTEDGVNSVAITPDGKYVVAGCLDGYVYFFNNQKILNNIQNIKNQIPKLESKINQYKKEGIYTKDAEDLLNKAKEEFNNKNYDKALNLLKQSEEKLNQKVINKLINEVENQINQYKSEGADLTEAISLLNKAKEEIKNANYDKALNLLKQSQTKAKEIYVKFLIDDRVQPLLIKYKSEGVDVGEAEYYLSKAKEEFDNKNYDKAIEYLQKSQQIAEESYNSYLEEQKKKEEEEKQKQLLTYGGIGLLVIALILGVIILPKKLKSEPKPTTKPEPITEVKTSETTPTNNIPDFPKELLNKYIPLDKIGEGGFGKVFKVKRIGGTQPIALKVPNLDEKAKKLLKKEIKAWQNLNHPNIVKMFDAFENPIPHIEMEYIDGYKLNGKLIRDLDKYPKPLSPKEAINLIKQISEGLKHAHSKNIIHRDIKPSNILLTSNLIPKITDWGLAKIGAKSSTATTTKALTLLYSAPEQIDEEEYGKTDKRTDIYQLGVLFYELLTGRLPYEGTSPTQISLKIVNPDKKPLPPSKINPSLSIFDGLFEKLLAKRKEDRFQSIDEFLEALKSIEELIKEKEELKKTLTQTKDKLKKSTDIKEIKRLTKNLIDSTTKLALKCAKANDKVDLLDALETLKDYVKSEDNKRELEGAIKHIEYLIKEQIPIGKQTIEALEVLLNRIKKEF